MKRRRVAIKPLKLMGWCSMDRHAGWSGEDVMLCPGGKFPEKLTCECTCHDDKDMQKEALLAVIEHRNKLNTPTIAPPRKRRIKRNARQ